LSGHTESTGNSVNVRVVVGIGRRHNSREHQIIDQRMIVGQFLEFSASQSVRPRVTNVRHNGRCTTEQNGHAGTPGTMLVILGPGQCMYGAPGSLYDASQEARRGSIRWCGFEQAL
jgi:hypothetical protein